MAEQGDDRPLPPTERRLQKAREEGMVAVSREVAVFATLGLATVLIAVGGPAAARAFAARMQALLTNFAALDPLTGPRDASLAAIEAGAIGITPLLLGVAAVGMLATVLQTGLLIVPDRLLPDISRLDPIGGLKRLFGLTAMIEAAKNVAKLVALGLIAWHVLHGELRHLGSATTWTAGDLAARLIALIVRLMAAMAAVQFVIAAIDVTLVRLRHRRKLMMSREEVRTETKETEGDPQVKQRLKQLRRNRVRRRMMAAVPKASVVVINPTHYAVALAYERGSGGAPKVVAKGADEVAARIRDLALEARVPIVGNPPLARALFRVEIDTEIPREHFQAVAEIIAYVWRLKARAATRR